MSRNTALRDRHRHLIARDEPPCHLCGNPIDYEAHHRHPLAFQIDHVTPINRGGTDTLDNIRAAHRECNRLKSDKPTLGVTYITERVW